MSTWQHNAKNRENYISICTRNARSWKKRLINSKNDRVATHFVQSLLTTSATSVTSRGESGRARGDVKFAHENWQHTPCPPAWENAPSEAPTTLRKLTITADQSSGHVVDNWLNDWGLLSNSLSILLAWVSSAPLTHERARPPAHSPVERPIKAETRRARGEWWGWSTKLRINNIDNRG